MHSAKGMTRLLIALLILRVIAAPITLRPVSYRPQAKDGFVVRVCAWPAQRAIREQVSEFGIPNHDDRGPSDIVESLPVSFACNPFHLRFAQFLERQLSSLHDPSVRRFIDCPRT
jgi:hypothetical protein